MNLRADSRIAANLNTMKMLIFLIIVGFSLPVEALRYGTDLDESQWITDSSPYSCRLEHYIAGYGTGAFVHLAGEDRRLELDGQGIQFGKAKIGVMAQPPSWQPSRFAQDLANIQIEHGELHLNELVSTRVATELLGGMMISFQGSLKENEAQPLEVNLSTVGFRGAFDVFTACEDQLLPASFSQLERSRIQYKVGQIEVDGAGRAVLRDIARYLEVDESVQQIFIDGHTDNAGLTRDNVKMSEQRAELVRDFLLSLGVSSKMLVVRFHAEKYPVVRNNTAANRAKNRRTTVRLSREFIPQLEPQDSLQQVKPAAQTSSAIAAADDEALPDNIEIE